MRVRCASRRLLPHGMPRANRHTKATICFVSLRTLYQWAAGCLKRGIIDNVGYAGNITVPGNGVVSARADVARVRPKKLASAYCRLLPLLTGQR